MKRLVELRVRVPGQWSDAWLYKGSLLLWTPDGQLGWLKLDHLRNEVNRQGGAAARLLADYLIFRTDWKVGEQFVALQKTATALNALVTDATAQIPDLCFEALRS